MSPAVVNLFYAQVQVERKKEEVYLNYLKKCILNNDCNGVKHSLKIIIVPYSVLNFDILENASPEIINLLIETKIKTDKFLCETYNYCIKENLENVSLKEIDDILTNVSPLNENLNYSKYVLVNLFTNKHAFNYSACEDYLLHLHTNNVLRYYKNVHYVANKIVCDGAYYANPAFLVKFITCLKSYGLSVRFDPMSELLHRQVFEWICLNVEKSRKGLAVGWRSGPDSSKWPSTDKEDYLAILAFLKNIIIMGDLS